ncbi:MAG: hypothetical protein V9E89_00750 [Ilumatobacteraceae bacterium]
MRTEHSANEGVRRWLRRPPEEAVWHTVRVAVGLMWVANLHWKVPPSFGEQGGGALYAYATAAAQNAPFAPFRWAMRELILPNFVAFGWVTVISESVLAVMLLVGYRVRLAGWAGAGMSAVIGLTVLYYPNANEWSWSYLLMMAVHLMLAVSAPAGGSPVTAVPVIDAWRWGAWAAAVGVAGLYVARNMPGWGRRVALLGSDAGFVVDGRLVRRWELKLVWFNPTLAVLTVLLGAALIASARWRPGVWVAAAGFAALAFGAAVVGRFDYARSDGSVQRIGAWPNVVIWVSFALAAACSARAAGRSTVSSAADGLG